MPEPRKLRVFLCHASQDKPVVRELYQRLLAEGWIEPWLDEEKLLPGQDWDLEIEKAVETSDVVIVCLSNESVTKEGYVQRELRKVLDVAGEKPEGTVFIIPLRLDEIQPPRRLRSWHYVDYFSPVQKEKSYQKILESLKLRGGDLNTRLSVNAPKEYTFGDVSFMLVKSGPFLKGDGLDNGERINNTLKGELLIPYDYCIGRDPITNEQFSIYSAEKGYRLFDTKSGSDRPVTGITWETAVDFAHWFNNRYNHEFPHNYVVDLPSADEWEKAARGTDGRAYPWGDKFDKSLCNTQESNIGETTSVGRYSPLGDSVYGVRDMAGNVWEWTRSSIGNVPNSMSRIMCGGSYGDESIYARCAFRMEYPLVTSADSFGFRLAIIPRSKDTLSEIHFPAIDH